MSFFWDDLIDWLKIIGFGIIILGIVSCICIWDSKRSLEKCQVKCGKYKANIVENEWSNQCYCKINGEWKIQLD